MAGFSSIPSFIAGATSFGLRHASASAESESSAMPCAIFAATFAVQGATTSASHQSARLTCPGTHVAGSSKRSVATECRERVRNVSGATNRCAPFVITTATSAPAFT